MRGKILAIVIFAGLAIPATLLSQAAESPARRASKRAQQLLASNDWQQAVRVSSQALRECESGDPGSGCRRLLYYTLGYIHQVQSRRQSGDATKLLELAARYYEQVLDEEPDHGPSLKNLAVIYSSLGDGEGREDAEAFLKSALARDTLNSSTYALLLGDRFRSDSAWQSALRAYQRAALSDPDDESARLRIVEVHRHLPATESQALLERLPEWESRFPQAARRGYEVVMMKTYRSDPSLAERALLAWVRLLAGRRAIDERSLLALPSDWRGEAVAGLREYLAHPYRPPDFSSNWWMQHPAGRHALAAVGLAQGVQKVAEGEVRLAEDCWNAALDFAPRGSVPVLDLRAELASLYDRYPRLDPDGEKFARIEHQLFQEKGTAYGEDDLDDIQRYHTVLAIIYAEKGVWTSSRFARNAIFQIEHALGTAIQRDARDSTYQPLAYLKSKLAEGYAATGNDSEAHGMYVEAAAAYLDSDDPESAIRNWKLARELGGAAGRLEPLAALIDLRDRLERVRGGRAEEATVCRDPNSLARTFQTAASSGLGSKFIARQRFKTLSDCADLVEGKLRSEYAAGAMEVAAAGEMSLVGARDLGRLETVQRQVRQLVGLKSLESGVRFSEKSAAAQSLSLSLPGTVEPAYVAVEPTTVLAGRIVGALRPEGPGLRLDIDPSGRISVLELSEAYSDAELTASLQRVKGVREVTVKTQKLQQIERRPPNR